MEHIKKTNFEKFNPMIEEILSNFSPYLIKGQKLYDEEDVKKMLIQILQKSTFHSSSSKAERE